jgi:hypothetical protein
MKLHAKFKCVLPEECPACGSEEYAIDGEYPDSQSGFEAESVECFRCLREMDEQFILRHAVVIAEKAEPYGSLRQDYANYIRENMR